MALSDDVHGLEGDLFSLPSIDAALDMIGEMIRSRKLRTVSQAVVLS